MKISDIITGPVTYNQKGSHGLLITTPTGERRLLGILTTHHIALKMLGNWDQAQEFQESLGQWVADAINEKLWRDRVMEDGSNTWKEISLGRLGINENNEYKSE